MQLARARQAVSRQGSGRSPRSENCVTLSALVHSAILPVPGNMSSPQSQGVSVAGADPIADTMDFASGAVHHVSIGTRTTPTCITAAGTRNAKAGP
jgi:hypothetical protein